MSTTTAGVPATGERPGIVERLLQPYVVFPIVVILWVAFGAALAFDRGILEAGAVRYAVGGAGDVVATGDWDCDGHSTLALLKDQSGQVWVFDAWAGPGQSLVARRAGRVERAVALEAVDDDGDGCDELLARRADGSRQLVPAST